MLLGCIACVLYMWLTSIFCFSVVSVCMSVCCWHTELCKSGRTYQYAICDKLVGPRTHVFDGLHFGTTGQHTHPFNGPLSGTTLVSQYQKGKTNPDFTEARDSEWQWHQLGHMQVYTSLQTDNHANTPPLSFLQAGCPSCCPTNSVKAVKATTGQIWVKNACVALKCLLSYCFEHLFWLWLWLYAGVSFSGFFMHRLHVETFATHDLMEVTIHSWEKMWAVDKI